MGEDQQKTFTPKSMSSTMSYQLLYCNKLDHESNFYMSIFPKDPMNEGTEDIFPHHPDDLQDVDWFQPENFQKILEITNKIKSAGNHFYKAKDFPKAVQKYRKACRYIQHLRDQMGSTEDNVEDAMEGVEGVVQEHVGQQLPDVARHDVGWVQGQVHLGQRQVGTGRRDLRGKGGGDPVDPEDLKQVGPARADGDELHRGRQGWQGQLDLGAVPGQRMLVCIPRFSGALRAVSKRVRLHLPSALTLLGRAPQARRGAAPMRNMQDDVRRRGRAPVGAWRRR